jgi:hypothetical protein
LLFPLPVQLVADHGTLKLRYDGILTGLIDSIMLRIPVWVLGRRKEAAMRTTTRSEVTTYTTSLLEKMATTVEEDRRATPRYPVNTDTSCPFLMPLGEDVGPAKIRDISTEGIGLLCSRPIPPGTLLVIGLKNAARNFSRTQVMQVAHTTQGVGGMYIIGGVFLSPLTYEELRTFLM